MEACPRCRRPVALARATCLYCGAPVDGAPAAAAAEAGPPVPSGQALVCLDVTGVRDTDLAALLDLTSFEAGQRVRQGGWQLLRRLPSGEARREAARLSAGGIRTLTIPEEEAAVTPRLVAGGRWQEEALVLHGEGGERVVRGSDVLLVVAGPITREYQTASSVRRVRTATLAPGQRYHLHPQETGAPLELDADAFDFQGHAEAAVSASLRLHAWIGRLAQGVPRDDGFRRLTPALAPAARPALADVLPGGARRRGEGFLILDNLGQFRAYSGWRAALARRLSRG